jgi:hypothetical protein
MATEAENPIPAEDVALFERRKALHAKRMEDLATLERRIGIPQGFFWSIRNEENDWAFIVKLGVICEAALTHALVLKVNNNELYDHFGSLQQGRRLELARQLGVIADADRSTLGAIAFVRNSFAHRVENLTGSLRSFFEALPQTQKIDLIWKLVQLDEKPKADENMSGHAALFKVLLFACSLNPLHSIASFGIDTDKRAEEERRRNLSLSDLFRSNPGKDEWWRAWNGAPDTGDTPLVLRETPRAAAKK